MVSSAKPYRDLSCLKVFLTIFTVFFLGTGVIFLATGIYGLVALQHYFQLSPELNLSLTPAILCGTGGIIVISGVFGMLSTFKNNKCLINCYTFLLGFVFITELTGGIASIIFMNKIEHSFQTGFTNALKNYNPRMKNSIDHAQNDLQCCGIKSYADWFDTTWANETQQCGNANSGKTLPSTCCKQKIENTPNNTSSLVRTNNACYCGNKQDESFINKVGCLSVLFGSSGQTLHYLLGVTFGVATIQLVGIILALCIYRKLREINTARLRY